MKKHAIAATLATAASLLATGAQAQTAGSMEVQMGWNKITPHVKSDNLSPPSLPDSKIDVGSASALLITFTYMWTDNVSLEFLGGLPYKHDIEGVINGQNIGKIGSIHQVSPTLLFQYRFLSAEAPVRPYVGAGPTYAIFYGSEGSAALTAMTNPGGEPTTIGSDRSFGGSVQVGLAAKLNQNWFIDASAIKTWITSSTPLSTGQSINAHLDPVSVNISLGYKF
jgi:outer membrane protein